MTRLMDMGVESYLLADAMEASLHSGWCEDFVRIVRENGKPLEKKRA